MAKADNTDDKTVDPTKLTGKQVATMCIAIVDEVAVELGAPTHQRHQGAHLAARGAAQEITKAIKARFGLA